jgi:hypothetical protein
MSDTTSRLHQRLFAPVDLASLAFFRILFGAALFADMLLYTRESIKYHWLEPQFLFKYHGFEWVGLLPGDGMYLLVLGLRALALLILLGFLYRPACALFFTGFTYLFLVDQAEHLNHSYLICLLSFLMIFIPAHRMCSIDALLRPGLRVTTAPAWLLFILRFQVSVVYVFAGLAKLAPDWLRGEPVRTWLHGHAKDPVFGPPLDTEATTYLVAHGGLVFDLLIVPLLLCRKSRPWAFAAAAVFHLANATIFDIGVFPWLMFAATTLFLDPDWPRRFAPRFFPRPAADAAPVRTRPGLVIALAIYAAVQLVVPLRHVCYPGDVNWTEEGHRFSWRMKLRDKIGHAQFRVTDPAQGMTRVVEPTDYVNPIQALRMAGQPDMILQFAHHLAEGRTGVQVRAQSMISLNARAPANLVDTNVDLAAIPRSLKHATWILPKPNR